METLNGKVACPKFQVWRQDWQCPFLPPKVGLLTQAVEAGVNTGQLQHRTCCPSLVCNSFPLSKLKHSVTLNKILKQENRWKSSHLMENARPTYETRWSSLVTSPTLIHSSSSCSARTGVQATQSSHNAHAWRAHFACMLVVPPLEWLLFCAWLPSLSQCLC